MSDISKLPKWAQQKIELLEREMRMWKRDNQIELSVNVNEAVKLMAE